MVVFGHELNIIVSSSAAAVKIIASNNSPLAGLRLKHRDVANPHPLRFRQLTGQLYQFCPSC